MTRPLFSADGLWIWSGNQWLPSKPSINPDQLTNAYVDIKFDRNQSRNILQMIKSNLELIGVEYKITTNRHAVKGIVESGSSEESHESDFDYVTLYGEEPWQNENSVTQEFETDEQESLLEGDENRGESEERITSDDVSPEELEIIQCPKCENVRLNVPNDYLGRISCPNCSAKFEYPSLEEVSTNYSTSNDKEQINIIAEEILTLIQSLNDAQIQIIENLIHTVKSSKLINGKNQVSSKSRKLTSTFQRKNNQQLKKNTSVALIGIMSIFLIIGPLLNLSFMQQLIIFCFLIFFVGLTKLSSFELIKQHISFPEFKDITKNIQKTQVKRFLFASLTVALLLCVIILTNLVLTENFTQESEVEFSLQDLDGDGLTNAEEWGLGTDINKSDTDNDGLNDLTETKLGTNPLSSDTDNDGFSDLFDLTPLTDWKASITYSGTETEFNEICNAVGTRSMTWKLRIEINGEVYEEYSYGFAGASGSYSLDLPDDETSVDLKLYYSGWYSNCALSNEQQLFMGFATSHSTSDPGPSRTGYEFSLDYDSDLSFSSRGTRDSGDYTESGWLASASITVISNLKT